MFWDNRGIKEDYSRICTYTALHSNNQTFRTIPESSALYYIMEQLSDGFLIKDLNVSDLLNE
jgi:hypothetical protein